MAVTTLAPRISQIDLRSAKPPAKQADSFYISREWKDARAMALAVGNYHCAKCGVKGRRTPQSQGPMLVVDHIKEIKDGGAKLDQDNLQVLCARCHAKKTYRARAARHQR